VDLLSRDAERLVETCRDLWTDFGDIGMASCRPSGRGCTLERVYNCNYRTPLVVCANPKTSNNPPLSLSISSERLSLSFRIEYTCRYCPNQSNMTQATI
jgi:hypothetical protein